MSFFDDASLAFLPSGAAGKDGKAYSIKPTDGTGDFTFSRGSNLAATRVGADGLIEKGRENLLLQSNTFSNASWLKELGASVTGNQSGYDGSSDAWQLDTDGTRFSRLRQIVSGSGVKTFSLYAKAGTLDWIGLYNGGGSASAFFDLTNGVTGNLSSSNIDASITSVGGGWYRCEYSFNESITDFRIYPTGTNGTFTTTAGNIYIQDAQLEIGLAATEVISTGATKGKAGLLEDEPRFDYSGGATCPSLLLEGSRTNLLEYSEYKASGNFTNSTPSYNATSSPEGLQNATEMFDNSTNGQHRVPIGSFSVTSGTDYTISAFVKNNDIGYCYLLLEGGFTQTRYYFNLSTGQPITSGLEVENFANGWYRIYVTQSAASTGTGTAYLNMSNNGVSPIYAGSNQSLYFYGLQAEQGSYATSYIPNHSGGTITRGADDMNVLNLQSNNLFGVDSGFIFYEFTSIDDLFIGWTSAQTKDRFQYLDIDGSANGYFRFRGYESNISLQVVNLGASPSSLIIPDGSQKICISWNASSFSVFADGSKIGTMTTASSIAVNAISNFNGNLGNKEALMKKMLWGNTAMSDADCITLTTI